MGNVLSKEETRINCIVPFVFISPLYFILICVVIPMLRTICLFKE